VERLHPHCGAGIRGNCGILCIAPARGTGKVYQIALTRMVADDLVHHHGNYPNDSRNSFSWPRMVLGMALEIEWLLKK
jgi:hypothetical protein